MACATLITSIGFGPASLVICSFIEIFPIVFKQVSIRRLNLLFEITYGFEIFELFDNFIKFVLAIVFAERELAKGSSIAR